MRNLLCGRNTVLMQMQAWLANMARLSLMWRANIARLSLAWHLQSRNQIDTEHSRSCCDLVVPCMCRLPWPEGTVIFDVAPSDAHAVAAAALKAADAHVPRACLLRRVVADYGARPSFQPALAAGGLRGDRLSVWALQVSTVGSAFLKPLCGLHAAVFLT